jgi:hypothetical protein
MFRVWFEQSNRGIHAYLHLRLWITFKLPRKRANHLLTQPITSKQLIHLLILLIRLVEDLPSLALNFDVIVVAICRGYEVRAETHADAAREELREAAEDVVTLASHDLALAWHRILVSSSPLLLFSSLFRRIYIPNIVDSAI